MRAQNSPHATVADPDLELKGRAGNGFVLLALPAFLPFMISFFVLP